MGIKRRKKRAARVTKPIEQVAEQVTPPPVVEEQVIAAPTPEQPIDAQFTEVKEEPRAKVEAKVEPKVKVVRASRFSVWYVVGPITLMLGIIITAVWFVYMPRNVAVGMAGIAFLVTGAYMFYAKVFKSRDETLRVVRNGESAKKIKKANTCNIHFKKVSDEPEMWEPMYIKFLQLEYPTGVFRKLENDGHHYFFNWVYHIDGKEEVVPAKLPDNQSGLTPRQFVIAVSRDNFRTWLTSMSISSTLQKIAPWVMVGFGGILGVVLIAV